MKIVSKARARTACLALLMVAGAVQAQYPGPLTTDANCNPAQYSELEQFRAEVCMSHVGCAMDFKIVQTACKAKQFLDRIGKFFSPGKVLSNEEVLEASMPEVPDTPTTRRTLTAVRATKPAATAPPQASLTYDGKARYHEGTIINGQPEGPGTTLAADGAAASGTWKGGKLNGTGMTRSARGDFNGGTFKDNTLQGEGFSASQTAPYMEGTFLDGKPDGMMNLVYSDGSTQRKLYKGGVLLAEGARAPKGKTAPDAVYGTPAQSVAVVAEPGRQSAPARDVAPTGGVVPASAVGKGTAAGNALVSASPTVEKSAPLPAASPLTGALEISLVNRFDPGNWPKLFVSMSQFEENERHLNQCMRVVCQRGPDGYIVFASPYEARGLANSFKLDPQSDPRVEISCAFAPQDRMAGYASRVRPEDYCQALLMRAIHEAMAVQVEFVRQGGQLFAAADLSPMAGANTGRCKSDLEVVNRESSAAIRRKPANSTNEQFVQTSLYFAIQQARVLENSCRGQPEAEGVLASKRKIGELYRMCTRFKTDVSVCKPMLAY